MEIMTIGAPVASSSKEEGSQALRSKKFKKCEAFFTYLLKEASSKQKVWAYKLVQDLVDGVTGVDEFAELLTTVGNCEPLPPQIVAILKETVPTLRKALTRNEVQIDGINPPMFEPIKVKRKRTFPADPPPPLVTEKQESPKDIPETAAVAETSQSLPTMQERKQRKSKASTPPPRATRRSAAKANPSDTKVPGDMIKDASPALKKPKCKSIVVAKKLPFSEEIEISCSSSQAQSMPSTSTAASSSEKLNSKDSTKGKRVLDKNDILAVLLGDEDEESTTKETNGMTVKGSPPKKGKLIAGLNKNSQSQMQTNAEMLDTPEHKADASAADVTTETTQNETKVQDEEEQKQEEAGVEQWDTLPNPRETKKQDAVPGGEKHSYSGDSSANQLIPPTEVFGSGLGVVTLDHPHITTLLSSILQSTQNIEHVCNFYIATVNTPKDAYSTNGDDGSAEKNDDVNISTGSKTKTAPGESDYASGGDQDEVLITQTQARMIGIISTFLQVHPYGATLDYICAYVQSILPAVARGDVLNIMTKFPVLFKHHTKATFGAKWTFNALSK